MCNTVNLDLLKTNICQTLVWNLSLLHALDTFYIDQYMFQSQELIYHFIKKLFFGHISLLIFDSRCICTNLCNFGLLPDSCLCSI